MTTLRARFATQRSERLAEKQTQAKIQANNLAQQKALLLQARHILLAQQWAYAESAQSFTLLQYATLLGLGFALLLLWYGLGGLLGLACASIVLLWYGLMSGLLVALRYAYQVKYPRQLSHPIFAVFAHLFAPAMGIILACGIVLALVLAYLPLDQKTLYLLGAALFFNLLQLLPLRPFLGGKILDLLSAWTWPRLLLLSFSACAALAAGLYASRLGLLLLAILLFLCVPRLWRQVRVRRIWRYARHHHTDSGTHQQQLLSKLAASRFLSSAARLQLINSAVSLSPRLGATASVFGFSLYAAATLLPMGLALGLLLQYPAQSLSLWQQGQTLLAAKPDTQNLVGINKSSHDSKLGRSKLAKDVNKEVNKDRQHRANPQLHAN